MLRPIIPMFFLVNPTGDFREQEQVSLLFLGGAEYCFFVNFMEFLRRAFLFIQEFFFCHDQEQEESPYSNEQPVHKLSKKEMADRLEKILKKESGDDG